MLRRLLVLNVLVLEAHSFQSSATGSLATGPGWNELALNRHIVRPIVVAQQLERYKRQLLESTRHDVGLK